MLEPMKFKDYTWPHNPRSFKMEYERQLSNLKIPYAGHVLQDLGSCARVFSGEGEFFGENAHSEITKLAEVFSEGGAGVLYHPLWSSVNAVFEKLCVTEEPIENYVRYSFRFVEYDAAASQDEETE